MQSMITRQGAELTATRVPLFRIGEVFTQSARTPPGRTTTNRRAIPKNTISATSLYNNRRIGQLIRSPQSILLAAGATHPNSEIPAIFSLSRTNIPTFNYSSFKIRTSDWSTGTERWTVAGLWKTMESGRAFENDGK
jgi:hypothetical protein